VALEDAVRRTLRVGGAVRRGVNARSPSGSGRRVRAVSRELVRPAEDQILLGDSLELLPGIAGDSFALIYIDPPFNTGRTQVRSTLRAEQDPGAGRKGFAGRSYRSELLARSSYRDQFDDYLGFLAPRLGEARRVLRCDGTL